MYQRILVPIDGSTASRRGLDEAIAVARRTGALLRLVHVVDLQKYAGTLQDAAARGRDLVPMMEEAGEQTLQQARECAERAGLRAETLLCSSLLERPGESIGREAEAWRADLIVVGTQADAGAVAPQILHLAKVPVLVVPA